MTVLILKNDINEGPKTIGDFLKNNNIPYTLVSLHKGEKIPDIDHFNTLIMMGGHMSANDTEKISYIKEETEIARKFMQQNKSVLGVCLGAQIMARALGAKVYKGTKKEVGWYDIGITKDGLNDPLMSKLKFYPDKNIAKVIQWHGETFDIPEGGIHLASSELYPNQAFKYGRNAYAFQFHIEVTGKTVKEWLQMEPGIDLDAIEKYTETIYEEYLKRANDFYRGFFQNT